MNSRKLVKNETEMKLSSDHSNGKARCFPALKLSSRDDYLRDTKLLSVFNT